jgi:voltage-gated potassium channel
MQLTEPHRARLAVYESRTSPILFALALAYIVVYGAPIIWPSLPTAIADVLDVLNIVIWAVFAADLVARAVISGRPIHYLLRHPIDVVLVIVPMLRVLRVLRVFTAANYLVTRSGSFAVGRTVSSAIVATFFIMFVGALAMLDAERGHAGATIKTFGDALWWAGTTITTVGYGDEYPVTSTGRFVAFALMLVGISMLGVITAAVAAWFVDRTRAEEDQILLEIRAQREELANLRAALGVQLASTPPATS